MWEANNRENTAHSRKLPKEASEVPSIYTVLGWRIFWQLCNWRRMSGAKRQTAQTENGVQNEWGCSYHAETKTGGTLEIVWSWLWLKQTPPTFLPIGQYFLLFSVWPSWGTTSWALQDAEKPLGREQQQPPQGQCTSVHTPWHDWIKHKIVMMPDLFFNTYPTPGNRARKMG